MTILFMFLALILPACPSDGPEATMCYWDAQTQGNSLGSPFIALTEGITRYPTNGR